MKILYKLILAGLTTSIISCGTSPSSTTGKTKPLITRDTTNVIEKNNKLFVFVGEKIDVTPIPYKPGDFDIGVEAKYKILQPVYGDFNENIIEFEAYDHYGTPKFVEYRTVLLFVFEHEGKYYQEKYMFDPLAMTKDGRWAGPYSSEYGHPYNKHTTVKPEKIDFAEEFCFPTKITNDDGKELTRSFQEPYFKTIGDKAIVVYGNYIQELFKLRRDGVLTARDLFDGKKEIELELSKDTTSEEH